MTDKKGWPEPREAHAVLHKPWHSVVQWQARPPRYINNCQPDRSPPSWGREGSEHEGTRPSEERARSWHLVDSWEGANGIMAAGLKSVTDSIDPQLGSQLGSEGEHEGSGLGSNGLGSTGSTGLTGPKLARTASSSRGAFDRRPSLHCHMGWREADKKQSNGTRIGQSGSGRGQRKQSVS